jgi:hypothetical protein
VATVFGATEETGLEGDFSPPPLVERNNTSPAQAAAEVNPTATT